jgi:formate dehydrogenase beta subunit
MHGPLLDGARRNGRRRRHIATDHGATVKVSSGVQPTLSNETLSAHTNAIGYGVLKSCLTKRRSVESIVSALSAFPLAPFEGEKFSLGIRMRELRDADDVTKLLRLIDDAHPGLMSQTYLIERYTHSVLEGLLIVALVIGAADILVHCNSRYSSLRRGLERELTAINKYGFDRHVSFDFSEFSPETHNDDARFEVCVVARRKGGRAKYKDMTRRR